MVSIRIATDRIGSQSSDMQVLNTFAEKLRSAGHEVTVEGRGPNKIQHVMLKKSCDVMIQVAGGKCLGTLVDFYKGIHQGYYHAKAGGFCYYKCYDPNWKAVRAHDDHFSRSGDLAPYLGKTLPEIYSSMQDMYMGYGTTAEEIANTWLQAYSGQSAGTSSDGGGGGGSVLDLIKQVCSPWDKLGCELHFDGNVMSINRSNPTKTAVLLDESMIVNNTVSISDYDTSTPNVNGSYKDQYLVERFGEIPLVEPVDDTEYSHVLQVAQRGHSHTIDLKCILNPSISAGKWVRLNLPTLGIEDRWYYVTKSSYDSEMVTGLTLEPAPPSIYVEAEPATTEDAESSDDETTETEEEET